MAEGDLPEAEEGEARFTTIETLALAAGDAVSLEVFEQQLAESGMGPPHCPHCGFEGQRIKQRERTRANAARLGGAAERARVLLPRLSPGFFSLGPKALGLDVDYDYSPTALKKVVYAGTQATSFPQGSRDLKELAELDISAERVRRATERIGKERVAERDAQAAAYEALPIPARRAVPADQPTPAVACVQMDGGRLQFFDRAEPQRNEDDTFWREMKVGCLWSMTSKVSAEDPCPQLPASFVDPERMRRMVREIKGFSGPDASDGGRGGRAAHRRTARASRTIGPQRRRLRATRWRRSANFWRARHTSEAFPARRARRLSRTAPRPTGACGAGTSPTMCRSSISFTR